MNSPLPFADQLLRGLALAFALMYLIGAVFGCTIFQAVESLRWNHGPAKHYSSTQP